MGWLSVIILVILAFFLLINRRAPIVQISLVAGNGQVGVNISPENAPPEHLQALILCYFAKVRWLTLTEPEMVQEILNDVYRNVIEKWPEQTNVEMLASLNDSPSKYTIILKKGSSVPWFITSHFPPNAISGDIATIAFFVLNSIIQRLNSSELKVLGKAMQNYYSFLFSDESKDSSFRGLQKLTKQACSSLNQAQNYN